MEWPHASSQKLSPLVGELHPLGCSDARIMTTLLHEMHNRNSRYGLTTMCIGVGQGVAVIVERI